MRASSSDCASPRGREEEIDHCGEHTDGRGHGEVAPGTLQQLQVADAHGQAHADDGSHERRHEHGADNHRRGIDIQAQRGDEYGEDENPQRRATETDAFADFLYHGGFVGHLPVEIFLGFVLESLEVHDG